MIKLDRAHLEHAARIADDAVANGPYPTALLAVADSRKTHWTHVAPGNDGARLDSIFPIASVSKPILATAVMRLVERGLLALNVPVGFYLPDFAASGPGKDQITTWHLLTHSSGLDETRMGEELFSPLAWERGFTSEWLYSLALEVPLKFLPGTAFEYNTLAYSVLGELIARIAKIPYARFLQEEIFQPLGMTSTGFSPPDLERAVHVHGFEPHEAEWAWRKLSLPGGGLYSSGADLVAFGQAYLRRGAFGGYRLLSPASIALMTAHYTAGALQYNTSKRFNYGLGWGKPSSPRDGDNIGSPSAYGHEGATGTLLWLDPEYDLCFVFLSNRWNFEDPSQAKGRALNAVYAALSPQTGAGKRLSKKR